MATLEFPHVVRDAVHGNIPFTALEREVIDHPLFQRLRHIVQLGFLHLVFPSATPTRFEHSPGVMLLAWRLLTAALTNQERLLARHGDPALPGTARLIAPLREARVLQAVRLAALIHDLGHGPFSHASETLTLDRAAAVWSDPALPRWLRDHFAREIKAGAEVTHEWYTLLMAVRLFADLPPVGRSLLRDVLALLQPGIGCDPSSPLSRHRLLPFLHGLLSSELDADRMDYLLRDSRSAGVRYGLYDLDRIAAALCFTGGKKPGPAIHESGLHAFEDYLISRYQMYLQVYTHKTNTAFEEMFVALCSGLALSYPADSAGFLSFTDRTFPAQVAARLAELPSGERARRAALADSLFVARKPWKLAWQATAFDAIPAEAAHFRRLVARLKKAGETGQVCVYESRRSLSRLAPSGAEAHAPEGGLPILRKNAARGGLEVCDIRRVSYVLDAFRKPIAIWRIYARPDRLGKVRGICSGGR